VSDILWKNLIVIDACFFFVVRILVVGNVVDEDHSEVN
jgi:hypothetical protein